MDILSVAEITAEIKILCAQQTEAQENRVFVTQSRNSRLYGLRLAFSTPAEPTPWQSKDHPSSLSPLNWCKQAWLLKNSIFVKTSKIWGIQNVQGNRERRL
jgi:hypothetical protein